MPAPCLTYDLTDCSECDDLCHASANTAAATFDVLSVFAAFFRPERLLKVVLDV